MPTFATLVEFTADARQDGYDREEYEEAVRLVESHGGEVIAAYYGDVAGYDGLVITEYPDHDSHYRAVLEYETTSTVRTDTVQVRSPEDHFALAEDVGGE